MAVLIFDGQKHKFALNESLTALDEQLPLFQSKIPHGSLALVAYTANAYYLSQKSGQCVSQSNKNLALNINWVIILGVPK